MNLFFSCLSKDLIVILEKNNKVIDHLKKDFYLNHVNNCVRNINMILKKNNLKFIDLNNIFVTSKIGSLTGKRVCFTILKTLAVLNSKLNFFEINSLIFQAGINKGFSLLKCFKNKYYCALIEDKKIVSKIEIISHEAINLLKCKNEKIFIDFDNINYLKNFFNLKNDFDKIINIKNYEI